MAVSLSSSIAGRIARLLTFSTYRPVQEARLLVSLSPFACIPEAPKRPPTPYMKFMKEKYPEIRKNNPGCTVVTAAKIGSQLWHDLDPEQQNAYMSGAKKEFQDYKQKYLLFLDGLNEEERTQLKDEKSRTRLRHRKELRRLGKPKRPPSGYAIFVRSSRLEQGNRSQMKDLAKNWQNMSSEEKEIYEENARREKERYFKEMEEWEKRMQDIGRTDVIRVLSRIRVRKT